MAGKSGFSVEDLLGSYPPPTRDMAHRLRGIILQVAPESLEKANRGWRSISFRDSQVGYFCGIFPFEDHVDLLFEFGALLPDPDGVLQGEAKQVRYLRFREPKSIKEKVVRDFIVAALNLPPQHALRRRLTQSRASPRPGDPSREDPWPGEGSP